MANVPNLSNCLRAPSSSGDKGALGRAAWVALALFWSKGPVCTRNRRRELDFVTAEVVEIIGLNPFNCLNVSNRLD